MCGNGRAWLPKDMFLSSTRHQNRTTVEVEIQFGKLLVLPRRPDRLNPTVELGRRHGGLKPIIQT